ncbi:LOW QUALITY PROTEIN: hypothetical protein OSB04_016180 [Centaurea solstitialis]|uniref:Uncharacterized protein n=1 Tax=Centaurea solstitialis TaxID=347529 RepID=A0AA38T0F5_9ASTR|nr:LOW QUALITY PROTEIN: hypothetical protein OSB04_016180 [Centaurea solstitialis]
MYVTRPVVNTTSGVNSIPWSVKDARPANRMSSGRRLSWPRSVKLKVIEATNGVDRRSKNSDPQTPPHLLRPDPTRLPLSVFDSDPPMTRPLFKFRELATLIGVEEKCSLCLDVLLDGIQTYMMLKNVIPYRTVFEAYDGHDVSFNTDLGDYVLADYDWVELRTSFKTFYELTLRISGSLYVTSNFYLTEICDLGYALTLMTLSQNLVEKKYGKYWGDPEKMNFLIFFANILYPMSTWNNSSFICLVKQKGKACFIKVKSQLASLFEDYMTEFLEHSQSQFQSQSQCDSENPPPPRKVRI